MAATPDRRVILLRIAKRGLAVDLQVQTLPNTSTQLLAGTRGRDFITRSTPGRVERHPHGCFRQSMEVRFRFRLVWIITRHPRFKPLYRCDVVSCNPLEQAEFLAGAGYQVAAVMMARHAIENRIKRVCMISLKWRECRKRNFSSFVGFLESQVVMGAGTAKQADRFYTFSSQLVHGKVIDYVRCVDLMKEAAIINRKLDSMSRMILRRQNAVTSQQTAPLSLTMAPRDVAEPLTPSPWPSHSGSAEARFDRTYPHGRKNRWRV